MGVRMYRRFCLWSIGPHAPTGKPRSDNIVLITQIARDMVQRLRLGHVFPQSLPIRPQFHLPSPFCAPRAGGPPQGRGVDRIIRPTGFADCGLIKTNSIAGGSIPASAA